MKKIQINVLSHHVNRQPFLRFVVNYLIKIKEDNKNKIKIIFQSTYNDNFINNITEELNSCGIEASIIFSGPDYMTKINNSINSDCEYSCSMDDDILINNYLWDYMIENIDILKDDKNLFLSPLISNGIPSVDYFIDQFLDNDDKIEMYNIFKKTTIPRGLWGVNYESLHKYTLADEWVPDNFYEGVSNINHFYKGIHPIRVSYIGHMKLAENIMKNFSKFEAKENYDLMFVKRPYFCNSFFFIKTQIWKNIVNDKTLICDGFDEVPLNMYKDRHDLNMVFVKNGFCIHMAYNTIGYNQEVIQNYFMLKIKEINE